MRRSHMEGFDCIERWLEEISRALCLKLLGACALVDKGNDAVDIVKDLVGAELDQTDPTLGKVDRSLQLFERGSLSGVIAATDLQCAAQGGRIEVDIMRAESRSAYKSKGKHRVRTQPEPEEFFSEWHIEMFWMLMQRELRRVFREAVSCGVCGALSFLPLRQRLRRRPRKASSLEACSSEVVLP